MLCLASNANSGKNAFMQRCFERKKFNDFIKESLN